MNVLSILTNWYVLMYIQHLTNDYDETNKINHRHSHARFQFDLAEYLDNYTVKLDALLRDYILVSAAMEASHGDSWGGETGNLSHFSLSHKLFNESDVNVIERYSLIRGLKSIFKDFLWWPCYGGEHWYEAVKSLEIKNPVVFIDHVVDLEHNCGSLLNKGVCGLHSIESVFRWTFKIFLDVKKSSNLCTMMGLYKEALSPTAWNFIERFKALYWDFYLKDETEQKMMVQYWTEYLYKRSWESNQKAFLDEAYEWAEVSETYLLNYKPLEWKGQEVLKVKALEPTEDLLRELDMI